MTQETEFLSGWKYRAVILSILFSAIGYLVFSLWGGVDEVLQAVGKVGAVGIFLALLMSLVNYGLRFIRWQGYLSSFNISVPLQESLRIYIAGFALTTTPGKAGEAFRGVLLKKWGMPYHQSLAAFFSERLSDLIAIVLLCLLGLSLYPDGRIFTYIGMGLVSAGLLLLSQRAFVNWLTGIVNISKNKLFSILKHPLGILGEAQKCHALPQLLTATLLSLIAWSAEALAFYWILGWIGVDASLEFAFFVYAISMLAGALSFMPGGLGGAEAVMIALLVWQGASNSDAVAATVLIRLATLWFAVLLGVYSLMQKKIKTED